MLCLLAVWFPATGLTGVMEDIFSAQQGLDCVSENLPVIAERLKAKGYDAEACWHGYAGFGYKDRLRVEGYFYDVIMRAGGPDQEWGALVLEGEYPEPGKDYDPNDGVSPSGGVSTTGYSVKPQGAGAANSHDVQSAINSACSGLPPAPKSLAPLVENLKRAGYDAWITNPNRPGFPGGKDKITVNGKVYDVIVNAGADNSSWGFRPVEDEAPGFPPDGSNPVTPPGQDVGPPGGNPGGGFSGSKPSLPDMSGVVRQVASDMPEALANSDQKNGGTWEFMDEVVRRLREIDPRWGYNWKRGNVGDPSQDVVDYFYGSGNPEGSTEVYIIDIIVGHGGPDPRPGWTDVTQATLDGGTVGKWTSRGKFDGSIINGASSGGPGSSTDSGNRVNLGTLLDRITGSGSSKGNHEEAISKARQGLPPLPRSLAPLVENLKNAGYEAWITNPNRPGFPGGKDKITLEGKVYDVIVNAGADNSSWGFRLVEDETPGTPPDGSGPVQPPGPFDGGGTGGLPPPVSGGNPGNPNPGIPGDGQNPGSKRPLPDMSNIVRQVASDMPEALANSDQRNGGTWEFMDEVVRRLREIDPRWGYNWKRGNVGDPSMDVVDYFYGSGNPEGSTEVYIIDIITGHGGPDPRPGWTDVTQATRDGGTVGKWTSSR